MKKMKSFWILGLAGILFVITAPVAYFWPRENKPVDDPWANVPAETVHVDHIDIIKGPFETGQDVTRACLECHQDAAQNVMMTTHWTWESAPVNVPWRDEPVTIGKKNQINNFCIGTQGNEKKCMTCHVGYGWTDSEFDFNNPENVDCLACHAETSSYAKGEYGEPAEGIDLLAAAKSVRAPTRDNCGRCHFDGGGGNGVKHGDLDESLYFPSENLDVHMGRLDFQCTDCHQTTDHQIKGRMVADNYTVNSNEQVACTDCHNAVQHQDERINAHVELGRLPDLSHPCHRAGRSHQSDLGLVHGRAGPTRRPFHLFEDQGELHLRKRLPAHLRLVQREFAIPVSLGRQA